VFAAGLSLFAALLVTGSLFIAERAPHSLQFLVISLVVSSMFLLIGVLLLDIQNTLSRLGKLTQGADANSTADLEKSWFRLLVYMILGGIALGAVLLLATYVILARIDQGFAVFG
jgi:hypothetical protein